MELRHAVRLAAFRGDIDDEICRTVLEQIEGDMLDGSLAHIQLPWTETLQQFETLSQRYTSATGSRSLDVLHVAAALALKATEFCTFDERQSNLAESAGLRLTR